MTEKAALLLAGLSHGQSWMTWPLPIIFGAATVMAGKAHAQARAAMNARSIAASMAVRQISRVLLVGSLGVFVVALCHFGCAVLVAHSSACRSNLKQLAQGMQMYAADYDEHLPSTARWEETIASRIKTVVADSDGPEKRDPFYCPAASSRASYGMNLAVGSWSEADIEAPSDTVLLFDADAPRHSFAGSSRDLARERHRGAPNVVYTDGHVKQANRYVADKLNWLPKAAETPHQTTMVH